MNYIFFGTPLFAVRVLSQLVSANLIPLAVVTNPDRPVGRKQIITPSAVKLFIEQSTLKEKVRVLSPEKLDKAFTEILKKLKADFFIVAAYGKIISREVLAIPPLGVIGVHPSLLPKYRGASPIQSALLTGETETGVSLYILSEKMDAGPIVAQITIAIAPDETYETLAEKLANTGGELLLKILPDLKSAENKAETQDETKATFTKKFSSEDGRVDLETDDQEKIYRKIQALNPEPGVWTYANALTNGHMRISDGANKRVKLLKAKLENGKLKLIITQVEGKKPQELN